LFEVCIFAQKKENNWNEIGIPFYPPRDMKDIARFTTWFFNNQTLKKNEKLFGDILKQFTSMITLESEKQSVFDSAER
jgi:hypothetical protein